MKFILDTARVTIYAFDSLNRLVWKTDPWVDNRLPEYRVKRPRIVYYAFNRDNPGMISLSYNNTQFGTLEKQTGKFHFEGQD